LDNFERAISPTFEKIKANQKQIQTLEKLRDTLLPKLMSGEVRVVS
jgi:type I restriction enzyme S subunit